MSKAPKAEETSSVRAKFILILFGIGPIILIGLFLASNGFFNPIR